MEELKKLYDICSILIEKEREEKEKHLNNWTVSEYAYHFGMETAYSNLKKELGIILSPC